MVNRALCMLCIALIVAGIGCGGKRRAATSTPATASTLPLPPVSRGHTDEDLLNDAVRDASVSARDVADLSDRMLAEGSPTFSNDKLMARLDILLNKSVSGSPSQLRHSLLRNLGIIHYYQKKYSLARQELQQANELYPRDARTHYYLARLAAQNGNIYQCKGLTKKAKGQLNLAANEMEVARKLEPSNPLYRQDVKQVIKQEGGTFPNAKQ